MRHGIYGIKNGGIFLWGKTAAVRNTLSTCKSINIVVTHVYGGGSSFYLNPLLKRASAEHPVMLVKPTFVPKWMQITIYAGYGNPVAFFAKGFDSLKGLQGIKAKITINGLEKWYQYDKSGKLSTLALERLVKEISEIKMSLDAEITYLVHDYYCLCPNFTLIAPNGLYCASEQTLEHCKKCQAYWRKKSITFGDGVEMTLWRAAFSKLFLQCSEVRTFSEDSCRRMAKCFPDVAFTKVPHSLPIDFPESPRLNSGDMVIGVFGKIQQYKGAEIVVDLANLLENDDSGARIVVVGELPGFEEQLPERLKVLGRYKHEDLPRIIEREGINISLMPSVCPETFSYVVHESMALGLPVACFGIGAQRDAVADYPKGSIIPEMTAIAAWQTLQRLFSSCRNRKGGNANEVESTSHR